MHFHRLIPFLAALNRPFSTSGKTSEELQNYKNLINTLSDTLKRIDHLPNDVPIYKLVPIKNMKEIGKSIPLKNVVAVPMQSKVTKKRG